MSTENGTENTAENYAYFWTDLMSIVGSKARFDVFGLLLRKIEHAVQRPKPRVVIWNERDDWIAICVKMGLNAGEIVKLSYSWPRPVTTLQQCYEMIERLHLSKLYKRNQKKLRNTHHDRNIIYAFSKLTGQAMEHGHVVRDVFRDSTPHPSARFRPDLALRVGKYQFYVEVQLSKIEGVRWHAKFANYLRLYETIKEPFRVLVLIDKHVDVAKLRQRARDILDDRPALNLFLFMPLDQFEFERDVLKNSVWLGAWHPKDKLSLLA